MSIDLSPALKATGGSRTGINPVNLLDVLDVNGNLYYFSDRPINAPPVITGSSAGSGSLTPPVAPTAGQYVIWTIPTVASASPGSGTASASALPGGGAGYLEITQGGPFTSGASVTFSGFKMPTLPPGAVVQALIPVASIDFFQSSAAGDQPGFDVPSGNVYSGTYSAPNRWDGTEGSVTDASFTFTLYVSDTPPGPGTFDNPLPGADFYDISGLAMAIYFTLPSSTRGPYSPGTNAAGAGSYLAWILQVPPISFHRSLQTDTGSFILQNVSGDSLSRDAEKILRSSTLEGALAVYRIYQPDAESAWLECHGTLTMQPTGDDTMALKFSQLLNPSQDDTPLEIYCETCQIQWGGPRCGSTESTECSYSFQTCQVTERIMIEANDYEKNYGEATANTALNVINRRRKI